MLYSLDPPESAERNKIESIIGQTGRNLLNTWMKENEEAENKNKQKKNVTVKYFPII